MKLYRIETEDQRGAFRGHVWESFRSILNCTHDEYNLLHPEPDEDTRLMLSLGSSHFHDDQYSFAFCSIEQLKTWFFNMEVKEAMNEEGLAVSVYETTDFHLGDSQAVFNLEGAKLLERISLLEI